MLSSSLGFYCLGLRPLSVHCDSLTILVYANTLVCANTYIVLLLGLQLLNRLGKFGVTFDFNCLCGLLSKP